MFNKLKDAAMQAKEAVEAKVNPKKQEEAPKQPAAPPKPVGPPRLPDAEAVQIARTLREAMKGIGTDEDKLIGAMAKLNSVQSVQVSEAFAKEFPGRDLVADIKSETGGKLEDTLVALARSAAAVDAAQIRAAVKGVGTDESSLIEVICTRTDAQIKAINQAYRQMFESFMRDNLADDLGGDLGKVLLAVVDAALGAGRAAPPLSQVDDDVLRLFKAGEDRLGTNEAVFISVLAANQPDYVHAVGRAYGLKHGHSLTLAIKKEFGEDNKLGRALLALAVPPHEFLADRLYHAMKGAGTDEKVVVRLIVGNRDELLKSMSEYFIHKYERSVARWVEGEFNGDLKKILTAICVAHQA